MYHIAICDDNKEFIAYIKRIIKEANGNELNEFEFYDYTSGEALIIGLDDMQFPDLLILDMELGGMDGDETAELFRKKFKDTVLVFCSGVRTPTVRSFKVTPYRYLLKSETDEQFVSEMREILEEVFLRSKTEYLFGHYRGNYIKIRIKDILYVENAKRGSCITLSGSCENMKTGSKILVDDKLSIIVQKHDELVFAHNSYLVNINHVERIENNEIYMDNGECLTVSRAYRKSFRIAFTKSIAKKY